MEIVGRPYRFEILGADDKPVSERGEGYAGLAHGETYKIKLHNNGTQDTMAQILVDGVSIGNFFVEKDEPFILERPDNVKKCLTFYKANSQEAKQAHAEQIPADKFGLVEVTFVTGRVIKPVRTHAMGFVGGGDYDLGHEPPTRQKMGPKNFGAGCTGLSGTSDQEFSKVQFIPDDGDRITLRLRLVHNARRKLALDVQPLPGRLPTETPAPPPVPQKPPRRRNGPKNEGPTTP